MGWESELWTLKRIKCMAATRKDVLWIYEKLTRNYDVNLFNENVHTLAGTLFLSSNLFLQFSRCFVFLFSLCVVAAIETIFENKKLSERKWNKQRWTHKLFRGFYQLTKFFFHSRASNILLEHCSIKFSYAGGKTFY